MKQRLTNNLGYKIISVVLATLLWLIVLNINDPEKTTTITNIPITIIHDDAITGQDKVYEIVSGKTATVRVTGPRTIVDSLEAKSFTATADLSKLSLTNAVDVEVELNNVSYRSKVELDSKTTMVVKLEDLTESEYEVQIVEKGTEPSGYIVYDTVIQDETVKVKAPVSVMNNIAKVIATVDVSKSKKDFSVKSKLYACDSAGNILDADALNITFDIQETDIDVVMYAVKKIPFRYEIIEENYANTIFTDISISKDSITLAGREEALAAVTEIVLDTTTLEVNEDTSEYTLSYKVMDLIPEGTYLYGDSNTVTITVKTDAIIRKKFTIGVGDIAIKTPAEGFTAYIETIGDIEYVLEGRKSILDAFEPDDNMFVSAKNLTEGTYEVELEMDLTEGIEQVGKVLVTVKVVPKENVPGTEEESTEDESESPSTEGETSTEEETTSGV